MGKFHFFGTRRHNRSDGIQIEIQCKNLNDNFECSIVSQIKRCQKECAEINKRISDIENRRCEMKQLQAFLMSGEMRDIYRVINHQDGYSYIHFPFDEKENILANEYNTSRLYHAISKVTDIDKLCDELKMIHDNDIILRDLHSKADKISQKITVLKLQLGIQ